ncbi:unnamed protein product [Amoebophrya sp. A120]|nr:unnamed protein product [Amoebophrya sp. A120]|eukprot:GSA120T00009474001.1
MSHFLFFGKGKAAFIRTLLAVVSTTASTSFFASGLELKRLTTTKAPAKALRGVDGSGVVAGLHDRGVVGSQAGGLVHDENPENRGAGQRSQDQDDLDTTAQSYSPQRKRPTVLAPSQEERPPLPVGLLPAERVTLVPESSREDRSNAPQPVSPGQGEHPQGKLEHLAQSADHHHESLPRIRAAGLQKQQPDRNKGKAAVSVDGFPEELQEEPFLVPTVVPPSASSATSSTGSFSSTPAPTVSQDAAQLNIDHLVLPAGTLTTPPEQFVDDFVGDGAHDSRSRGWSVMQLEAARGRGSPTATLPLRPRHHLVPATSALSLSESLASSSTDRATFGLGGTSRIHVPETTRANNWAVLSYARGPAPASPVIPPPRVVPPEIATVEERDWSKLRSRESEFSGKGLYGQASSREAAEEFAAAGKQRYPAQKKKDVSSPKAKLWKQRPSVRKDTKQSQSTHSDAKDTSPRPVLPRPQSFAEGQLLKTQPCVRFFQTGACQWGKHCNFYHTIDEKKPPVDLRKTRLCPTVCDGKFREGKYPAGFWCPGAATCPYAHSEKELRLDPMVYKSKRCLFYARGHCRKGANCTHYHSETERIHYEHKRQDMLREKAAQKMQHDFLDGARPGTAAGGASAGFSFSPPAAPSEEERGRRMDTGVTASAASSRWDGGGKMGFANQFGSGTSAVSAAPATEGLQGILVGPSAASSSSSSATYFEPLHSSSAPATASAPYSHRSLPPGLDFCFPATARPSYSVTTLPRDIVGFCENMRKYSEAQDQGQHREPAKSSGLRPPSCSALPSTHLSEIPPQGVDQQRESHPATVTENTPATPAVDLDFCSQQVELRTATSGFSSGDSSIGKSSGEKSSCECSSSSEEQFFWTPEGQDNAAAGTEDDGEVMTAAMHQLAIAHFDFGHQVLAQEQALYQDVDMDKEEHRPRTAFSSPEAKTCLVVDCKDDESKSQPWTCAALVKEEDEGRTQAWPIKTSSTKSGRNKMSTPLLANASSSKSTPIMPKALAAATEALRFASNLSQAILSSEGAAGSSPSVPADSMRGCGCTVPGEKRSTTFETEPVYLRVASLPPYPAPFVLGSSPVVAGPDVIEAREDRPLLRHFTQFHTSSLPPHLGRQPHAANNLQQPLRPKFDLRLENFLQGDGREDLVDTSMQNCRDGVKQRNVAVAASAASSSASGMITSVPPPGHMSKSATPKKKQNPNSRQNRHASPDQQLETKEVNAVGAFAGPLLLHSHLAAAEAPALYNAAQQPLSQHSPPRQQSPACSSLGRELVSRNHRFEQDGREHHGQAAAAVDASSSSSVIANQKKSSDASSTISVPEKQLWKTKYCEPHLCQFRDNPSEAARCCPYAHSREELRPRPDFRKTSLCATFAKSGSCKNGLKCRYAHSAEERAQYLNADLRGTKICEFYATLGRCKHGKNCSHSHISKEKFRCAIWLNADA